MESERVFNFSAGPATLPVEVMEKAQAEFVNFRGIGYGIAEASHRSSAFEEVIDGAEANVRKLLGVPDDYAILFLQGGASTQFAMVAMNLMLPGKPALYADTGAWAAKAVKEAKLFGEVTELYSGADSEFTHIGDATQWAIDQEASYAYICSNNTIRGTQYHFFPDTGDIPLVADMSSDILSRRLDMSRFDLIFAGAQKNLGPAGVTLVIMKKELADRAADTVPTMLKYSTHIDKHSLFNTPPCFSIYMVGLVLEWLVETGGLEEIETINETKSHALYEFIDMSIFYQGTAEPGDRSKMNVTFRLPEEELEALFVKEAAAVGLTGLKGHRSVGGIRASIYNAMPLAGVSTLIDFMADFEERHG
ncbi:MAG: 3-phosphoserine/phosphohydroxythreonine transaminase [Lentisphaerae bacterium]|nr:3-phosphoserine/phosphohydroxythreonine transaminase [Lentisphaerota bacterium]MBT4816067.1 3-phosphoserine/phosphohydroxythreonine transaminase [Lentisphaerota bacterium]MBT5606353.1 3-phosphoserine/phosphohydroxythreonine transaminase [Lentisphaerota bacterium]MBT7056792.1 3-phosphoserine/phosphohydroxythreonine transaminase [Lentisphaerota bacterium]MBT7840397.1 3-phosphoserine/phosphohydroxythreonine transaminase [Lentisphaerota bacterium]